MKTASLPGDLRYQVFIAHAGCDTDSARELHGALQNLGLTSFVDAENLELGDVWDDRLASAQAKSMVTAVLISSDALQPPDGRPAHYWLDEIASAIELTRNAPNHHRVVPVYLEGHEGLRAGVPYGMRRLNALFWEDVSSAAGKLRDLVERLIQRVSLRSARSAPTGGDQHDLLIDVVGNELRFIHLSDGRIAESAVRYDPAMLNELQKQAPEHGQYDQRVAEVVARNLLPRDLRARLATLDDNDRIRLHLTDLTWPLPWEVLVLGGLPLSLRCAISRQPRATGSHWFRRGHLEKCPKVLVFTSAGKSHEGVSTEGEGVAEAWRQAGADVRLLPDVSLLDLEGALGEAYDVLHFAGHAWWENGESYIWLGGDLHREESGYKYPATRLVEVLKISPPSIVCLNSHYTALVGPVFRPDKQAMVPSDAAELEIGFARPLLEAGVPAFVGTYGSPADLCASDFGIQFHKELADGVTVGEAAFAGRHWARLSSKESAWADATVAMYVVAGDAETRATHGKLGGHDGVGESDGTSTAE